MPTEVTPTAAFPADLQGAYPSVDLLAAVLDTSLTGLALYSPLRDAQGQLVDLRIDWLNPAAQRILQQPAQPAGSYLEHYPHTVDTGVFAFHRDAFESGAPARMAVNYQGDGLDNYFLLAARRVGAGLLVSFTDTADQPRSPVEEALRESQAAERAARADAETQRQRLYQVLLQLPAQVATYHGPEHVYTLVNQRYQDYFPTHTLLGRAVREAVPEAAAQGFFERLDQVYTSGEPAYGQELPVSLDFAQTGQPQVVYINATYLPLRDAHGQVDGVLDFSYDVTEQVVARQQLQALNQELEARVQARTREADVARAEAEEQRSRLERLFRQAPALINIFSGPEHVLTMVHPGTAQLLPHRPLLGLSRRQALPELPEDQHAPLDRVFRTGEGLVQPERLYRLDRFQTGELQDVYLDVALQPLFDAAGRIEGVMSFALDVTERVQARQRADTLQAEMLAAAQRQVLEREAFHNVFEQTPALIALLRSPAHRFEYVNPAYQQLFPGRPLVGRDLAEAVPELQAQGFVALLDRVYESGDTHFGAEVPLAIVQPDGGQRTRYYNFTYQAYREAEQIVGISIFAYDVTEQVLARQRVAASREQLKRFQFMADQARDPFILIRADGSFAYLNQRALEAWGYTAEEMQHLRVPDLDPIYQGQAFTQLFTQAQHEVIPLFETLHRRRGGYVFPVEVSATGLQLDGQPHLLVVARDITAQKRYVAALQESEARFRTMADAAPNMVWAVNPDSTIRYVNRAFLDFVGLENEQQYMATGWGPYIHPDEFELTQGTLTQAIEQRQPYILEHRMLRHDGQYRWLLAQGAPSYLADGELYGYVGSAIDITELKQANEQLRRTNVDLDNFIYTASHDLKAPISNIEGLLQLLHADLPLDVVQGSAVALTLGLMSESVERFKRTIEHLTEVSKLQQEHAPATTAVDVAGIVEEVCQDLAPLIQTTDARVRVEVTNFPPVLFSEKNLRSVVYNLLSNALKYHSPDRTPHIDVRAHIRPGFTVLEVHDNGLGIAAAHLSKLFTMFQRFHDHVEGTGVGLYMVKKMVENAGGRVEVHSQAGAGTTFFILFPLAPDPAV